MVEFLRIPQKPIRPKNFQEETDRAKREYMERPERRGSLVGHYLYLATIEGTDYDRMRKTQYPDWERSDFWEMLRILRAVEKEILAFKRTEFEKERDARWAGFTIPNPEDARLSGPFPDRFDVEMVRSRSHFHLYPDARETLVRYWNTIESDRAFCGKNFPKWQPEHFRALCLILWEEERKLIESRLAEYQKDEIDRRFGDLDLESCIKRAPLRVG